MLINIVGSGLSGATCAAILKHKGHNITVFETRNHIAGNCYDSNVCGTMVHNYGPHLFHTNDEDVFAFLSQYTEWFDFLNKPKGNTKLGVISLPYSKKTVNEIGRELTQEEIVDVIFKDYSEKQWGTKFENIPNTITNRVPKTANLDDPTWYEGEKYQCLPKHGYTNMIKNMFDGVEVKLNCEALDWKKQSSDLTIYTGKIDEYFNFCYGKLPYRSLEFKHHFTTKKLINPIINQNTSDVSCTRTYDHSFFTYNHKSNYTIVTEEYSTECKDNDIPFYPIPFGEGMKMYTKYKLLADKEPNTIFVGRLATYTYLDMWMTVKQAMLKCKNITV